MVGPKRCRVKTPAGCEFCNAVRSASCPVEVRNIAVGRLAKPYRQKELMLAIGTATASLEGRKPKRVPKGLTLYA